MSIKTQIEGVLAQLVADNTPAAKTNVGKLAAEYAAHKLVRDYADKRCEALAPALRDAAMFDTDNKVTVYDNKVFSLTATRSAARRTLDRTSTLVALATRFKLTMQEAEKFLDDNCYKTGASGSVSLSVVPK